MYISDQTKLRINLLYIIALVIGIIGSIWLVLEQRQGQILGATDIKANVYACQLEILVKPEERFIGNWPTIIDVEILNSTNDNLIGEFQTTTDNFGFASVDLCNLIPPIHLVSGTYTFSIKGYSHLTKLFVEVDGFNRALNSIDFSPSGELIPGDVNFPADDEINSLDSTHIIRTLGKNTVDPEYNTRYDLNLDGAINNTDIEILINNFYKQGDSLN
jgi:hypothetical protein